MTLILRRDPPPDFREAACLEIINALTHGLDLEIDGDTVTKSRGYPKNRYDWVLEHRQRLWPDVPLDFENHRYLEDIYKDEHPQIAIMKAAQMGMSEWAITDAFWACDSRGANVLYILPRTGDVSDFSTARVGMAIEASPYIAGIISPDTGSGYEGRSRDRVNLKRVRHRFLYLRHGSVQKDGRAPQLKAAAIDVVIFDELDEMDQRAPPIAEKRLGHSRLKWQRKISTPSLPQFGIHDELLRSDYRVWQVKCSRCGTWQELDPFQNLIRDVDGADRPKRWFHKRGHPEEPYVGCKKCSKRLDRTGAGEWVPMYPEREMHGYHVNKLASTTVDLMALIRKGMTFNETARKEWWNQDLGLPYQPTGAGWDDALLNRSMKNYNMASAAVRCAMGVDVGAVLNVVIRQYFTVPAEDGREERVVRRAVFIGEVADFDDLDDLMRRYDVRKVIVDALPETRAAKAWAKKYGPSRVKLAYYVGGPRTKKDDATTEKPSQEYIVDLDRTRWFDELKGLYDNDEVWNPRSTDSRAPLFKKHYKAITRVVVEGPDGIPYARWQNSADDHYAHADLYCNAALELLGPVAIGETAVMVGGDGGGRKDTVTVPGEQAGWDYAEKDGNQKSRRRRRKSAWQ